MRVNPVVRPLRVARGKDARHPTVDGAHLERLWARDVTITTGLVDTYSTPTLLRLLTSHQIDAQRFVTHRFGFDEFIRAYDVFSRASETGALKVVLSHK